MTSGHQKKSRVLNFLSLLSQVLIVLLIYKGGNCSGLPVSWSRSLAYDGGGYWTVRTPVIIENKSGSQLLGYQVQVALSANNGTSILIGESVSGLRVADSKGTEFFFELENSNHIKKRNGLLSPGDIVTFPVEAEIDSSVVIFLYAGNDQAWLPPDIREFSDDKSYSEQVVNEWLETKKDIEYGEKEILIRVGMPEIRKLSSRKEDSSWIAGINWEYRVPVQIRNFGEKNIPSGAITINTRSIQNSVGKLFGFEKEITFCLIDPEYPDAPLEISGNLSQEIRTLVNMTGLSEKIFWLYMSNIPDFKFKSRVVEMFSEIRDHPDLDARTGKLESREKQSWPLTAWAVDPLIKVFQHDLMPGQPVQRIKVYATRNSSKSFQIAIRSSSQLETAITITPLKNSDGQEIPEPKIYKAGFVPVDFPVRYYRTAQISEYKRFLPKQAGSDGWPGWWPDPLIPLPNRSRCELTDNNTQPLLFDINIPANTIPGFYGGHVILESGDQKIYLPVEVKVWNLSLPEKRHIPAIYDLRTGPGRSPFNDSLDEKAWSRFLSKYNVSPGLLSGADPDFTRKNGKVSMDASKFDEVAGFLIGELNNTMLYTPGFFYSVHWFSGARPVFGLEPYSPEYVKAWKDAYALFVDHITKKGWRKNFVLYLSDEPRIPLAYDAIARVSDMAREVAPDIPIYVSSWDYIPEIAGHITAWGIGAQGQFPLRFLEERRKAGDRFIYTTDGQQCLDTPYPATERMMPWFCFKYGVEAFEFWGSTWWTFDPWKYGWHAFYKERGGEQVKNPVRYPNGDGYLAYPGDAIGVPEPVPSIRLIAVREGVDDFEIFHALDMFARKGNQDANEALDVVRSLVIQPHPGGMIASSFMPDPNAVINARILAGEVLDRLLEE